jgi:hypothetical protein
VRGADERALARGLKSGFSQPAAQGTAPVMLPQARRSTRPCGRRARRGPLPPAAAAPAPRHSLHHVRATGHHLLARLAAPDAHGLALHGKLRGKGGCQRACH